jgi:DNA-binding NarL/FixJ family response regulator
LLASGFVYGDRGSTGNQPETVKTYVKNICKKLHVRNRLEAVARYGHK